MRAYKHTTVLLKEAVDFLSLKKGGTYLDATLGGGGHLKEIAKRLQDDGTLVGLDQDIDAITNAKNMFKEFKSVKHIVHSNFSNIDKICEDLKIVGFDGVVLDLGLSLNQLRESKRGFSFQNNEKLDMRMDLRDEKTACDVINYESEKTLADIFFKYGEERYSRRIASAIIRKRKEAKIEKTSELVKIITKCLFVKKEKKHPATRVFQALRIYINSELDNLKIFLDKIFSYINEGGRICIISFHSLEDRIVKKRFRYLNQECICPTNIPICKCNKKSTLKIINKKIIKPTIEEIKLNPMSRSAKLRVAEVI